MLKLVPGTRFWKTQLLGFSGLLLLLMGTAGPLLRHRVMEPPPSSPYYQRAPGQPPYPPESPFPPHLMPPPGFGIPGGMGFPFGFSGPSEQIVVASLVTSPTLLQKVGGALLLLLGGTFAFALLRLQLEKLNLLAAGVSVFIFLLFVHSAYDLVAREQVHWRGYLPYYNAPNGGLILGWAWFPLLASPILLWLAAREGEFPSQKERERLFAPKPVATTVVPASALQSQTASDIGLCAQCNTKNSLRATRCHACAATLPWETARLDKSKRTAQKNSVNQSQVSARKSNSRAIALNGLANFAIFAICFWLPFLSYFIWRHLDNEGSPYAGAGFLGALSGALVFGGGFLLRLLLTMAKVGLGAE